MIGCTSTEFDDFREEERRAFPEYFRGECIYSIDAAVGFMVASCRVPFSAALAWVCRSRIQYIRSGLFGADRPASPWALGSVKQG
jgi:hypothetical protein